METGVTLLLEGAHDRALDPTTITTATVTPPAFGTRSGRLGTSRGK